LAPQVREGRRTGSPGRRPAPRESQGPGALGPGACPLVCFDYDEIIPVLLFLRGIDQTATRVQSPMQMMSTERALTQFIHRKHSSSNTDLISGYTPGSDEHGPRFIQGPGGGARGCDFERTRRGICAHRGGVIPYSPRPLSLCVRVCVCLSGPPKKAIVFLNLKSQKWSSTHHHHHHQRRRGRGRHHHHHKYC